MESLLNVLRAILERCQLILNIPFEWSGYKMQPNIQDSMTLERLVFTDESTIGEIRFDGEFFCFSLEDTCRNQKIPGKTAIPPGHYQIIITQSERFGKPMPLLVGIPGYSGVRIHVGNSSADTSGCILVGLKKGENVIYDSRLAYDKIYTEIQNRLFKAPLYMSVIGGNHREVA